jgi:alkylated DNA nucleotide flippase Atl1
MCPREIARAAQQLGRAIRQADQEAITTWQEVLRSLETTSRHG